MKFLDAFQIIIHKFSNYLSTTEFYNSSVTPSVKF